MRASRAPPDAPPSNNKNSDPQPGSGQGQGRPPPPQNADGSRGDGEGQPADDQRVPGQMTREEARELLDSVKGDERHSLGIPVAQRNAVQPPDKPYKNW